MMKLKFVTLLLIVSAAVSAHALEFNPLVDDWMISEEISVTGSNVASYHMDVASCGSDYLVVWNCQEGATGAPAICGVVVGAVGTIRPDTRFEVALPGMDPEHGAGRIEVASDGDDYLVVWRETMRNEAGYRMMASRISRTGDVLDPDGIELRRRPYSTTIYDYFDVESNGAHYLICWNEREDTGITGDRSSQTVYGVRINQDGRILDQTPILLARPVGLQPQIAVRDDGSFRVVCSGVEGLTTVIDVAASGEATQVIRDFPQADPSQTVVVSDGEGVFAAWDGDDPNGDGHIVGSLLPLSFSRGNTEMIDISRSSEGKQTFPSIASDGNGYFVIWSDGRNQGPAGETRLELYGARVSSGGELLDPEALPVVTGSRAVVGGLACNGSNYLLAIWDMNGTSGDGEDDTITAKLIISPNKYLVLSEPVRNTEGGIEFQFNAAPGHAFAIEHTEDFSEWTELTRFDDFSGEAIVSDQPGEAVARFYRARRRVDVQ